MLAINLITVCGLEFEKKLDYNSTSYENFERTLTKLSYDVVFENNFTPQMMIFDFNKNSKVREWRNIDDVVMGGVSKSNITINKDGNGVFSGHVSLDNNGGFSSVRHQFSTLNVSDYNKFVIRIKGDGKNYQFRVKSKLNEYHSYKHEFSTNKSWQIIEIPFDELKATFRGRLLDMDSFSNTILEEIGFLISNKKEEYFQLEIDFIKLD